MQLAVRVLVQTPVRLYAPQPPRRKPPSDKKLLVKKEKKILRKLTKEEEKRAADAFYSAHEAQEAAGATATATTSTPSSAEGGRPKTKKKRATDGDGGAGEGATSTGSRFGRDQRLADSREALVERARQLARQSAARAGSGLAGARGRRRVEDLPQVESTPFGRCPTAAY